MADLDTVLFFSDQLAYAWKVDQLARTDGTRDTESLLRYTEKPLHLQAIPGMAWLERPLGAALADVLAARASRKRSAA